VISVLDPTRTGNGHDPCAMLAPLAAHCAAALDLSHELEQRYV
jgi:hypothetical protein